MYVDCVKVLWFGKENRKSLGAQLSAVSHQLSFQSWVLNADR
jgi:hypothetical protein